MVDRQANPKPWLRVGSTAAPSSPPTDELELDTPGAASTENDPLGGDVESNGTAPSSPDQPEEWMDPDAGAPTAPVPPGNLFAGAGAPLPHPTNAPEPLRRRVDRAQLRPPVDGPAVTRVRSGRSARLARRGLAFGALLAAIAAIVLAVRATLPTGHRDTQTPATRPSAATAPSPTAAGATNRLQAQLAASRRDLARERARNLTMTVQLANETQQRAAWEAWARVFNPQRYAQLKRDAERRSARTRK